MTIRNLLKKGRTEDGFTLIELIIAVAVIGILVAVGVPSYFWFQGYSKVEAIHANNHQLLRNFEVQFAQQGGYHEFDDYDTLGSQQAIAGPVANKVTGDFQAQNNDDDMNAFVFTYSSNGLDLITCASTIVGEKSDPDAGVTDPGVARTDCIGGENPLNAGPRSGLEQYN